MKRSVWFAVAIFAWLCAGCSMFNPGGQVKEALTQSTRYGWDADQFTADIKGTQEAAFTMIEGDIVLTKDADGNMVPDIERSTITAYLYSNPTSKGAVSASAIYAELSTRQTEALSKAIGEIVSLAKLAIPTPEPAPEQPIP